MEMSKGYFGFKNELKGKVKDLLWSSLHIQNQRKRWNKELENNKKNYLDTNIDNNLVI